jgi:hypothetical protein
MNECFTHDPVLGYVPSIPEPFWYSGWRTLFRYRPACYQCGSPMLFKTRLEWDGHYVLTHLAADEAMKIA